MTEQQETQIQNKPTMRNAIRYYSSVAAVVIIIMALVTAAVSFYILLGFSSILPTNSVIIILICINLFWVVCLISLIVIKLYPLIKARQARRAASRLHSRIVSMFSIVATLPALVVAIVAVTTLNLGLDRWFDTSTRQIINSSINIANAYSEETLQTLKNSAYGMAIQLDNKRLLSLNPTDYQLQMTRHAAGRDLRGVFLLSPNGKVFMSSTLGGEDKLPIPPADLIKSASDDKPFLFQPGQYDYFGVVLKFNNIPNTYLYVVRNVDQSVLEALRRTEANTDRYRDLEASRLPAQIAFGVLYLCLFLIMLLSAIWTGIAVTDRIVRPIRLLIGAADDVAAGNLEVIVPVRARDGDIGQLSKTFNTMVRELNTQHSELIVARDQIDERRRFSEAVLAGVTAGVVGVDENGDISTINRSAESMFNITPEEVIGKSIFAVSSDIGHVFEIARSSQKATYRDQVTVTQQGRNRVFNVQTTMEDADREGHSWVVTIDDITDLVEAQRSSAWADVARRIAHEIKNPLTPIQLSAERIRRRYGKVIVEGRDIFDQCVDTIIRQVGDIGHMVDEFSSFARMPKPEAHPINVNIPLRDACFLIEVSRNDIKFERDLSHTPLIGNFDERMIGQAFGNVIKNASEAIDGLEPDLRAEGHILVRSYQQGNEIYVEVIDNGKGLPKEQRQKLLEPYMTTREKGTGLGLAIVRKVVEEHNGHLELHDAPEDFYNGRGAMIRMVFSLANISLEQEQLKDKNW